MTWVHWTLLTLAGVVALGGAGHALLYKRDPRAAFGWIAVCLMFPLAGPLLYALFGVNRVRTRAQKLHRRFPFRLHVGYERPEDGAAAPLSSLHLPEEFAIIARISDAVTRRPLVGGNRVEALHNGEAAYPAMLEAIAGASGTVYLSSYIFDADAVGQQFVEALAAAVTRGVEVRVLVDGVGERYSRRHISTLLRARGVRVARFLPPRLIPPTLHLNLRNHRKLLVVDGHLAFTGGMNISERHLATRGENPERVVDVHFRFTGPVVRQMELAFLDDWGFVCGEQSVPPPREMLPGDGAICRSISDGPNEDLGKLQVILLGAISSARARIDIMTPYFLPSQEMIAALQSAALRGVAVTLVLPAKNNLPYVHWATRNMLWELLQFGVRVFYQPAPFVHSKLLVVDGHYAQVGTANIDPRSLRLNFEFVVEIYDARVGGELQQHIQAAGARGRAVTLAEVDGRPLPVRTRDALAWLFSPYL